MDSALYSSHDLPNVYSLQLLQLPPSFFSWTYHHDLNGIPSRSWLDMSYLHLFLGYTVKSNIYGFQSSCGVFRAGLIQMKAGIELAR